MFRFSQSLDFDYPAALVWAYLATARVSCRFSTVAPGSKWWLKQALSHGSGVEACREIRSERPATRVVMLTSSRMRRPCSRRSSPELAATC